VQQWITVKGVETIDDAIAPIDSPIVARAVRENVNVSVLDGVLIKVDVWDERPEELKEVALGLRVEVCHLSKPLAIARFWYSDDPSCGTWLVPLEGDVEAVKAAVAGSSKGWTCRIAGDGEMALRDLGRERYWSGEYSVPLADVVARVQTPRARAAR
jgi:hypothetical protein